MADRHSLYKHAAKEIAWQHGYALTFMAKWDERHAGSSMHVHASLWGDNGATPLFAGTERIGPVHVSPLFRWFLGGWMAHVRDIFAFYAPYPASYKRLWPVPLPRRALPGVMTTAPPPSALWARPVAPHRVPAPVLMPIPTWPLPRHSLLDSMALPDRSSRHPSSQVMSTRRRTCRRCPGPPRGAGGLDPKPLGARDVRHGGDRALCALFPHRAAQV